MSNEEPGGHPPPISVKNFEKEAKDFESLWRRKPILASFFTLFVAGSIAIQGWQILRSESIKEKDKEIVKLKDDLGSMTADRNTKADQLAPFLAEGIKLFPGSPEDKRSELLLKKITDVENMLNAQAEASKPTQFSPERATAFEQILKDCPKVSIAIQYQSADNDGRAFAHQLAQLFTESGFQARLGQGFGTTEPGYIRICMNTNQLSGPAAVALNMIIEESKRKPITTTDPHMSPSEILIDFGYK